MAVCGSNCSLCVQAEEDTQGRPQEVPEKKGAENLNKQADSGDYRRPGKDPPTKDDMSPPEEGEQHSKMPQYTPKT